MLTETQWQQYEHKTARTGFFVQKRGEPKRETPRVTGNLFLQVEECNPLKSK